MPRRGDDDDDETVRQRPKGGDARGPVMGASAASDGTTAFEESAGILGAGSRRLRHPQHRRRESSERLGSRSRSREGPASAPTHPGGSGAVAFDGGSSSGDSSSDGGAGPRGRDTPRQRPLPALVVQDGAASSRARKALHDAAGSGKVYAASSSSSSSSPSPSLRSRSTHSSDTVYATPSTRGDETGRAAHSSAIAASHTDRRSPLPPPARPPPHALAGNAHGATRPSTEPSSSRSSSSFSSGPRRRHSDASASTVTTSSTDSDDDSDEDTSEGGDEGDEGTSVGQVYSKMTVESEAASSRVPFSSSGLPPNAFTSPASGAYYAATRDVRSSLVSTMDVDVAVAHEQRRLRQHQLYLHAALYHSHLQQAPRAAEAPLPGRSATTAASRDDARTDFLRQRADAVYLRHMDAFVEHYLSAPRYRTALAQFRKHLPTAEQQLRTRDARAQYASAAEIGPHSRRSTADASGTAAAAAVGAGGGEAAAAPAVSAAGASAADGAGQAARTGADRYRLEKTDLELLAGDAARRGRLLDDTLPWRPVDFDTTTIRLEPLEHLQGDLGATADGLASGGGATVAVGGSVNLLIEVLLLTEMDVPFTSTIPMVNYTNVFLLLASLFVQSEVLLTKLIRFYRSVRAWEAEVDDTSRAAYLERRVLQCILVYCRVHESDLTLSCLQRLAAFAASEGFLGPVNLLNDAVGKERWPCMEGVYSAARRRAAAYAGALAAATAAGSAMSSAGPSPTSALSPSSAGPLHHLRHLKRHGFLDGGGGSDLPQRLGLVDPAALLNPATRAPLQNVVAQTLLEFIVYLQRVIVVYYRPVDVTPVCTAALPFTPEGPLRMFVDTAVPRPSVGCTSSATLRTAAGADPRLVAEPLTPSVSVGARFGDRVGSSTALASNGSSPSRDGRLGRLPRPASRGSHEAPLSLSSEGREEAASPAAGWAAGAAGSAAAQPSTLETTVLLKPLSVVDIDSERLARQICLLSFSLFSAVHIRELLNNAWTDAAMKVSVTTRLTELMEFSARLQRWTAAVIATPTTWADCQRRLRYFLEVCRMLYEQQNYEMAAAVLEGLRHPSVELLERAHVEARGQSLLTSVERRELETLQELMDPFASYSPSSLYSVAARTVGDMETPMIPLLAPILGVIFRSEDSKGTAVSIRSSDGQAVVNWSKVIGLGKMVVLWMRCQYTPFAFPVDPGIQEFLWSTMKHQWTDALLLRAARRAKQ